MGKDNKAPPPPDLSGVTAAFSEVSALSRKLGQQQYEWARNEFTANKGQTSKIVDSMLSDAGTARDISGSQRDLAGNALDLQSNSLGLQDRALDVQDEQRGIQQDQRALQRRALGLQAQQQGVQQTQLGVQQSQLDAQGRAQDVSSDYYNRDRAVFQPAQDRFLSDAENYNSATRRDQVVGAAQAGVAQQFDAARDAATRKLEGFGINPASTRFAALDIGTRTQEAAAKAAAANQAALANEDRAFALRQQAIAMGKDNAAAGAAAGNTGVAYGGNAIGAGNTAVGAGNTAVGAGNMAVGAGNAAIGAGGNVIGAGNSALGAANSALSANNAAVGANSAAVGATGNAAGISANALGGMNQTYATGASAMGNPTGYLGAANSAASGWGDTLNKGYSNQLEAQKVNNSASSGVGSLLGAAAGIGANIATAGTSSIAGKLLRFADGGAVDPNATPGGAIPMGASPSQGQTVDDVPARLTAGEFVLPKDVTSWYGEKHLQGLIQKARKEKERAVAKPAIGNAPAEQPTFQSRPAIPMGAAA